MNSIGLLCELTSVTNCHARHALPRPSLPSRIATPVTHYQAWDDTTLAGLSTHTAIEITRDERHPRARRGGSMPWWYRYSVIRQATLKSEDPIGITWPWDSEVCGTRHATARSSQQSQDSPLLLTETGRELTWVLVTLGKKISRIDRN